MKIILYGINYTPELTGIGKYTGEMAEWLVAKGHKVEVITAMPYYPDWQIQEKYKGKNWFTELINGVKVHRCPLYVPKNVSAKKRILHDFSFLLSITIYWVRSLFQKKADWVVAVAPPFHLGILPLIYSKIKGTKMVTHIQDLQVDAARDLGMIKNTTLINIMFGVERLILKNSTLVSTLTPGMQKKIEVKRIATDKITLLPNWVDFQTIKPLSKEQSLRNTWGIPLEDKVILYSGNIGEKQGLEILIDIAENYCEQKNIHFLIVGAGAGKERLHKLAEEKNLTNVRFYPLQPVEKLSALLATADLHLVLQKSSASDLVMPSKLTNILAVGGASIITAEQETSLYDITHKYQLGILCKPESKKSLLKAIDFALQTDLNIYSKNAQQYAKDHLDRDKILTKFIETLKQFEAN